MLISLSSVKKALGGRGQTCCPLFPCVFGSVLQTPPVVFRVSGAVSDVCARMEVAWRAWLCPRRHICQYLPLSSLHFMAVTRSLGLLFLLVSLASALQHPNAIFVCVCVHSWRRCADESLINRNQRLRRTAPLLENISRYVLCIWNLYFRHT